MTGLFEIIGQQRRVVAKFHLIGRMSHAGVEPHAGVTVKRIAQTQLKLIALAVDRSEIGSGSGGSEVRGDGSVATRDIDVGTLVGEHVHRTAHDAIDKSIVETDITLGHFLPAYVGIAETRDCKECVRRCRGIGHTHERVAVIGV